MNSRLPCAAAACCVIALSATKSAAKPGSATLQVSNKRPHIGETFQVQLIALVDRGSRLPSAPKLKGPRGMVARGPDISAQTRVNIVNGKVVARVGIGATWTLKATKAGTYTIGPGSVVIDGKIKLTRTVSVSVRPTRMGPSPKPFDPFDPFSFPGMPKLPGFGGADPDDQDDEDELSILPPYPSEYRLDRAPDKMAFMRAEVTPRRAVVGQQVTLAVYAYGKRGPFRETHTAEPSREAFLAYTLLENSYSEPMYRVPVAQSVWHAKKVA